ncbi:MAG: hypothetical protein ACK4IK_09540 [Bacteroidia bacterium]
MRSSKKVALKLIFMKKDLSIFSVAAIIFFACNKVDDQFYGQKFTSSTTKSNVENNNEKVGPGHWTPWIYDYSPDENGK